tara:strand:- start:571 stop:1191 length:621 start_codon:yes stop_codon:yes gene_type:complete
MAAARAVPEIAATPFFLYVFNHLNGTAGMNVVHNALYARQYARVAEAANLEFVSYYPDYHAMKAADRSDVRLRPTPGVELNLRTSAALRSWRTLPGVSATEPGGAAEQLLYFCYAFNLSCTAPSPSPPGPTPSPLSAACKAAVRRDCPVAPAACAGCVREHASDLIASGCPKPGPGAVAEVVEYCENQKSLAGIGTRGDGVVEALA